MLRTKKNIAGFSLIELSIVLIIVGLLLATVVTGAATLITQSRVARATADLRTAEAAIIGFVLRNGRLPCPDTDDYPPAGPPAPDFIENQVPGGCSSGVEGYLPATTLGVNAYDPWGNPYFYRVVDAFADDPAAGEKLSFAMADDGDITILDDSGNTIADLAPLVLYSVGPNSDMSLPAGSGNENENIDGDANYIYGIYAPPNAPNPFDDVVHWLSLHVLKAKMLDAGLLP